MNEFKFFKKFGNILFCFILFQFYYKMENLRAAWKENVDHFAHRTY